MEAQRDAAYPGHGMGVSARDSSDRQSRRAIERPLPQSPGNRSSTQPHLKVGLLCLHRYGASPSELVAAVIA